MHGQHCAHGVLEDPVKKGKSLIFFSFGYSNFFNAVKNWLCQKATYISAFRDGSTILECCVEML